MAKPTTMVEWLQGLPISWLVSNPVGKADVSSYGQLADDNIEMLKEAVKARFPDFAPDEDAIQAILGDRVLVQNPSESAPYTESKTRAKTAWDDWARAGTPLELLVQLYFQGLTPVIIQQNGLGYLLTAPPTAGVDPTSLLSIFSLAAAAADITGIRNPIPGTSDSDPTIPAGTPWWSYDYQTGFCSRFVIIFDGDPLSDANTLSRVRAIVQTWKPAKATCVQFIDLTSGNLWGYPVTLTWGQGGLLWGPATVNYYAP